MCKLRYSLGWKWPSGLEWTPLRRMGFDKEWTPYGIPLAHGNGTCRGIPCVGASGPAVLPPYKPYTPCTPYKPYKPCTPYKLYGRQWHGMAWHGQAERWKRAAAEAKEAQAAEAALARKRLDQVGGRGGESLTSWRRLARGGGGDS